jgi:hypothetical protein
MNTNNLETFSLIWLDECEEDKIFLQQRLRTSINYLKKLHNPQECERHIRQVSIDDRIILIVNDQWCHEIIPRIHQLRQVSSIYIYCTNDRIKENEQWAKDFNKVMYFYAKQF